MPKPIVDSYTNEVVAEEYVSKIPGINQPRSLYREGEAWRCTAQYAVSAAAEEWKLVREGCPESLFPRFSTEAIAAQVMDWCVLNDASVAVAIHWLARGNIEPFFNLLDRITEVATQATMPETVCPRAASVDSCTYPSCDCAVSYAPADSLTYREV